MDLILKDESYAVMGACFEVFKEKGCGFLESVYQECLAIELETKGIPFVEQPKLELEYKGQKLEKYFEADFVCFGKVLVEIKAVKSLSDEYRGQVHNYLRATGFSLALLVNFGARKQLEWERIVVRQEARES